MKNKTLFKDWIVTQMAISGCNQSQLAQKLSKARGQDIHRSIISNWVHGRYIPEPSGLLELAKVLELPEGEIIGMLQAIINTLQTRKR